MPGKRTSKKAEPAEALWQRFPTGESNSNRNYEVFWGDPSEPRAQASGFLARVEDRHASTQAYIDYMRPRCQQLARVLKPTGSFYYHCDWRAKPPKRGQSFTTGIPFKAAGYPWQDIRRLPAIEATSRRKWAVVGGRGDDGGGV